MFDARLRPIKQRSLAPFGGIASSFPPVALTVSGLTLGLGSAVLAANGRWTSALALFVLNRIFDGLDGEAARGRSEASDEGGYADMMADAVVYAAVPIGAAIGSDIDNIWPIASVLLASFYVNGTSWMYLSAVLEKRRRQDSMTSIVMPDGLVEGAETIGFFTLMLLIPGVLDWTMGVMAAAVFAGAAMRFAQGHRSLRSQPINEIEVNA